MIGQTTWIRVMVAVVVVGSIGLSNAAVNAMVPRDQPPPPPVITPPPPPPPPPSGGGNPVPPPNSAPEPTTMVLGLIGAGALAFRRFRRSGEIRSEA